MRATARGRQDAGRVCTVVIIINDNNDDDDDGAYYSCILPHAVAPI